MLKAIMLSAAILLSGCVAYPYEVQVSQPIAIGFYDPTYGYWTGYGWDVNYYAYGHRGYGHERYSGPRYGHVRARR